MDKTIEDFFFAWRGKSVDAAVVMSLVENDFPKYRQALAVARGNNVRVLNEYRSRRITGEVEYERQEFVRSLSMVPKGK